MFILYYANKLSKTDIMEFTKKEGITLNNNELDIIYSAIKNDAQIILSDFDNYVINYKNKLSPNVYKKILELKEKYKSYLD